MNPSNYLKILAYTALTLGFFALIVDGNNQTKIESLKIAELIESENDHFTVQELADSLMRKKQNLRIFDLRSPKEYPDYHIPNSENISINDLIKTKFTKKETIILYSEGGIHAAQIWILLKEKGLDVYSLKGGLDAWKNEILFPEIPENPSSEEKLVVSKAKRVSFFFGGKPVVNPNKQISKSPLEKESAKPNQHDQPKTKKSGNYGC